MKFLMNSLENVTFVMLHVRQHPHRMKQSALNENRFWLPGEVSSEEAKKLGVKFIKNCDTKKKKETLETLIFEVSNNISHSVYEFGLTTYLHEYKGLQSYVKGYLMLKKSDLNPWQEILGILSLAYYYGQASVPCQLFATMLGQPPNYQVDLDDFPSQVKEFVVPCEEEGRRNYIRIGHNIIAKEILEQILTRFNPNECSEIRKELSPEAKRQLQRFALRFIDFLKTRKIGNKMCGTVIGIVTKVFIERDYKDVGASDIHPKKTKMTLSHLLDDIHSPPPCTERVQLLEKIVEAFPENPEFHAHLGRIYGIYKPDDEESAEKCYQKALQLCDEEKRVRRYIDDEKEVGMMYSLMHVYHMYGMFYDRKISKFTGRRPGDRPTIATPKNKFRERIGEILHWAEMACELFSSGRENTPPGCEQSYGYVGEITARLQVCDFIKRTGPYEGLSELMVKLDEDKITTFVKKSCTCIMELITDCYSAVDSVDLGGEFNLSKTWYDTLFKDHHPQLEILCGSDDISTRRLKASLIKLRYGGDLLSENVPSQSDVEKLVRLYEENFNETGTLGVDTSRRSLDLDYRDWIKSIRLDNFTQTYTLEDVLIYVRQWYSLVNTPESKYYLFIMLSILGFGSNYESGNGQLLIEALELRDQLKSTSKYLRGSKTPREWLGKGPGIRRLVPMQKVVRSEDGERNTITTPNGPHLALLKGTIKKPNNKVQSGLIVADLGNNPVQVDVFFVPIRTKEKLIGQGYAGERVEFSLAFTRRIGYEAYNVAKLCRIQCISECGRYVEIKSNEDAIKCKCGQLVKR